MHRPTVKPTKPQLILGSGLILGLLILGLLHLILAQAVFQNITLLTTAKPLPLTRPTIQAVSIHQLAQDSLGLGIELTTQLELNRLHDQHPSWDDSLTRWFTSRTPTTTVTLSEPIYVYSTSTQSETQTPIIQLESLDPFRLPLDHPPSHPSHPTPTSQLNLLLRIRTPHQLNQFINQTRYHHVCHLRLVIPSLTVQFDGSRFPSWISSRIPKLDLHGLESSLDLHIPKLPPIFDLITIDEYSFYPIENSGELLGEDEHPSIGIRATASIPNPMLELAKYAGRVDANLAIRWRIPLLIYLQDPSTGHHTLMATALTLPFNLSSDLPRLALQIDGRLLPALAHLPFSGPLSDFLNAFLKDHSNLITIRYDPNADLFSQAEHIIRPRERQEIKMVVRDNQQLVLDSIAGLNPQGDQDTPPIPAYLSEFLADNLDLTIKFPGFPNVTNLVKPLSIKDFKIDILSLVKRQIRCSGAIEGVLNLPEQLQSLMGFLNMTEVLPDVILLDGALPGEDQGGGNGTEYPSNAFGRLELPDFLPASLVLVPRSPAHPARLELRASFRDARLRILDGRFDVFRAYAAKYLLHHKSSAAKGQTADKMDAPEGVLTSVLGSFDALGALAHAFPLGLSTIPLTGSFYV